MWWKKQKPEPPPPEEMGTIAEMTVDEQILAAENVMTCRDALNMYMSIIDDHRSDGHDCLPYCMPVYLYEALKDLEAVELMMILTVALKDMYDVYHRSQMGEL